MNFPQNLKYTKDHEWVRLENGIAFIGVTDFAQSELGDIVFIEVETVGQTIEQEAIFGTIEAVKTVSDLFSPLSGEVIALNEELEDSPEKVNDEPYGAWIIQLKPSNLAEIDNLLSADEYRALIGR